MPTIRPSAELGKNYNEISDLCHRCADPVFITRNGKSDLAIMSIEAYENLCGRRERYGLIGEGLADEKAGKTIGLDKAFTIRKT